ncbi:MAG: Txe/YoeB family addiction module toxin [Cytophagales bacterium]|nr:MAG: Txe/YoeB family addiction module toxin [Cytophagales bacterium]
MRKLIVEQAAQEDLFFWARTDPKLLRKILQLIEDAQKNPFSGLGKPEALKHDLKGLWSRRISDEHRLVYMVNDEALFILQCRWHYSP